MTRQTEVVEDTYRHFNADVMILASLWSVLTESLTKGASITRNYPCAPLAISHLGEIQPVWKSTSGDYLSSCSHEGCGETQTYF